MYALGPLCAVRRYRELVQQDLNRGLAAFNDDNYRADPCCIGIIPNGLTKSETVAPKAETNAERVAGPRSYKKE